MMDGMDYGIIYGIFATADGTFFCIPFHSVRHQERVKAQQNIHLTFILAMTDKNVGCTNAGQYKFKAKLTMSK